MEGRTNMTGRITIVLLLAALLAAPVAAFDRRGKIDDELSYKNLKVSGGGQGKCRISGTLINRSDELFDPVFLTFYARNNQGRILWDTLVRVGVLDARGQANFSDTFTCTDGGHPYTIDIKATK